MARIIGCLVWYDEDPAWLSACIASMSKAIDHFVAVDGAYALYPDGRARSGVQQEDAIKETCLALGIGLTLHVPQHLWFGNEVEKRTFLFRLAEVVAEPDDWYWVMDGDQIATHIPSDLRHRLENTDLAAAKTRFWEQRPQSEKAVQVAREFVWDREHTIEVRNFFRALPGLHCENNHYTYVTGDGRKLWGNTTYEGHDVEDCLDLTDLRIEHRTQIRDMARKESAQDYYRRRDRSKAEAAYICHKCRGEFPELRTFPTDFSDKDGKLTFGHVEACNDCGVKVLEKNVARLKYLGVDPNVGMAGAVKALQAVNA